MGGKDKKKKGSSSGEEQSPLHEKATISTRQRSESKRRKAVNDQQKITSFTHVDKNACEESQTCNTEHGQTEIIQAPDIDDNSKTVMAKLNFMNENILEGKKQYVKMDEKLEKILGESFEIRKENSELKKIIQTLQNEISAQAEEIVHLKKSLDLEKEKRNSLEQYTRRDNVKIINLKDHDKETTEETEKLVLSLFRESLGITSITEQQVSIAHRVGPYRTQQNRPVIVKLISRKSKALIMKNRKTLRKTHPEIYINEDLTKLNAQRLKSIKDQKGVTAAWSFQGNLYCRLVNGKTINIENNDIDKIHRILKETRATREQWQQYQQNQHKRGRGQAGTPDRDRRSGRDEGRDNPSTARTTLPGHSRASSDTSDVWERRDNLEQPTDSRGDSVFLSPIHTSETVTSSQMVTDRL